jgi:hypothetical protein
VEGGQDDPYAVQGLCPIIPNIMVNYLRQQVWGSKQINTTESSTAYLVLDRLHDCFVEPQQQEPADVL